MLSKYLLMLTGYHKSALGTFTRLVVFSAIILSCTTGCNKPKTTELYHKFQDKSWARFNILSFEIPVKNVDKPYNVYLFATFTPAFAYEKLEFNMVMNTPAGEERINQYAMDVKSKSGKFSGECKGDSCRQILLLKRELNLSKPGILKIELENLTPRLTTEGISGVGIRMVQSGK